MNLRFVEAYYWVVSLKSISRAAEKMYVTQSAMSSRIAALEDELGVLLLDRSDKQFRLTVAGIRFFKHAQKLLALQRDVLAEMRAGGGGRARAVSLRIGAIESVLHSWLIDWLQRMREREPGFELELTVETTPVLVEQVRRGAIDLAFTALPATGAGLHSRELPAMEMVFVGHRAQQRKRRYTLAELAGLDLLTFQRGSQPHAALLELLRAHELKRVHNISSISAMVQLVEGGFGVATLPLEAVQRLTGRLPLKALACEAALPPLPIHASWRDDPTSRAAADVVDAVSEFVADRKNR